MPPRTRTPNPGRRPKVAGLRDPRRHQDAPADDTATAVDRDTAATSSTPGTSSTRERPGSTASTAVRERTAPATTRDSGTDPSTGPVSLRKTPATGDEAGTEAQEPAAAATATTAAAPTRSSKPTPTGRARTTRRRPAPATGAAGDRDRPRSRSRRPAPRGERRAAPGWLVPVLAVVVVALLVVAGLGFFVGHEAFTDPKSPASNDAVVDASATAETVGATRQAVERIFSFDPTKLDDSEAAARDLGTGDFPRQYAEVFDRAIRPAATSQQLRQTASVLDIGVRRIDGDQANLITLIQLDVTRGTTGQSTTTPGLLDIDLQRVGGQWKVSKVSPLTGTG